jgi:AraC-like DNA-binding protein
MVERMTAEPTGFRVDQAAAALHLSTRTLQRLFAEYVGVSPKWVLRRARLQEAATRADQGDVIDWARLAADLGYADQAHLTRDFTATVGLPPARYSRSLQPDGAHPVVLMGAGDLGDARCPLGRGHAQPVEPVLVGGLPDRQYGPYVHPGPPPCDRGGDPRGPGLGVDAFVI